MARTSKDAKTQSTATTQSTMSKQSTMSTNGSAWSPSSGEPMSSRPTVGARSGGLGIGSPIYEELVAELGDPAA